MGILHPSRRLLFFGPETPRPPGLNTSHPIASVYLDRFPPPPNACPGQGSFYSHLLEISDDSPLLLGLAVGMIGYLA